MNAPPPGLPPPPETDTAPAGDAASATGSDLALARHAAAMRRPRAVYFAVVTVVVLALGAFVGVVWSRGEAAHVTLHTASKAAPTLAPGTPPASVSAAWRTNDRAAIGTPQYGGTVVTWSEHTVRGRDARTGRVDWSYTRTDRSMCTAAQVDGTTIAVYAVNGNCDEISAFDSGRGRRRWTRTLDEDGQPFNGRAAYQWNDSTFMLTGSSVIYALDPGSGLDRFIYSRYGCAINRAVLGSSGALISQTCGPTVRCANLQKCGTGRQLLLRDGVDRRCDSFTDGVCKGKDENPDLITWNDIGNSDLPVSADSVASGFNPSSRRLTEYRVTNGRSITAVRLSGTPRSTAAVDSVAVDTSGAQLVWLDGVTYALTAGRSDPVWATPTISAPTAVSASDTAADLATGRFTVTSSTGVALLDGDTGRVTRTVRLPSPSAGGLAYPLGAGFLVAGSTGVIGYQ